MSRSLFLSITSALALASGCSDDCGPLGAPDTGLTASSADVKLTFGHLVAGANNDCPAADAPSGVVSLTIMGMQTDGAGLITFCVPRPDKLSKAAGTLGSDVKIVDLQGDANSCTFTFNSATIPNGTVTSKGMCNNGTSSAGFQLVFDGNVVLSRTCAGTTDTVPVALAGTIAVKKQ